jgi:uncharacterized protein YebE (UPF0316 family)
MWIQILIYVAIFAAKLIEVALATVRNVLVKRGEQLMGALIGFVEVMIWIIVVSNVLSSLTEDPIKAIVYCLAFACGNYAGVILEGKLAIGTACIQVMVAEEMVPVEKYIKKKGLYEKVLEEVLAEKLETDSVGDTDAGDFAVDVKKNNSAKEEDTDLKLLLRERGFGVTIVPGHGFDREVNIMMIYLKRKSVPEALELIRAHKPTALVTVNDVRQIRGGFIRK